jgi:Fic family protein
MPSPTPIPSMTPERFGPDAPGRLVPVTLRRVRVGAPGPTADRAGEIESVPAFAFVPDPLPPKLDWRAIKADLFEPLTEAVAALARVNGLTQGVPNARILRHALWLREAKLSSQIEDIHTTALDMVLAGSGLTGSQPNPGKEAWNAVEAVRTGLESDLPFSGRLIRDMHRALLVGVRGERSSPGEYRDGLVYIGSPNDPTDARYIPPPQRADDRMVDAAMDDLERFANTDWPGIPPLACVAMMHYQFEAIHPFRDGNGRIGRALILHQLCRRGLLDMPVVSPSGHFHRHRRDYVDLMFNVSADGAWTEWIRFFVEGVAAEAVTARVLAERIITLHRRWSDDLVSADAPARLVRLLDKVFEHPVVSVRAAGEHLGVSHPTARKDIALFEELGILAPTSDASYGRTWYCPELMRIIETEGVGGG